MASSNYIYNYNRKPDRDVPLLSRPDVKEHPYHPNQGQLMQPKLPPTQQTQQELLDRLAKIDAWVNEPTRAANAIHGTIETINRLCDLAAEQGVTTEEILSRALAALEAQFVR
jgi:hypothetical protein